MGGIKITKIPKVLDTNRMVEIEILERNKVCPFCGETREFTWKQFMTRDIFYGVERMPIRDSWYGKHDEDKHPMAFFRFWERNKYWKRSYFKCHTCGCEWETEPYPANIKK